MNIGITSKFTNSFFSNGLNQNLVLLYEAMELCGMNPFFIDFTHPQKGEVIESHKFINDKNIINFWDFRENHYEIDILLCPGVASNNDIKKAIKEKNPKAKIVAVKYGNNLFSDIQNLFLSKKPKYFSINVDRSNDYLLYSPHYSVAKQYLEFTEQCESSVMPYIWDPKFVELECKNLSVEPNYTPQEKPNIAIMEPNLNFSKTSTIPFLSLINLLEQGKDIFNEGYIFSSQPGDVDYSTLSSYLYSSTILKQYRKKIFFDPRQKTPFIFNRDNPIIFSHQFHNELNYLHLEAAYYNFPLVHNSEPFKDFGYYYEEFNLKDASRMIELCVSDQKQWSPDKSISRDLISKYSIANNCEKIKEVILKIYND